MTSLIFAVGVFFLGLICVSHLYAHHLDPVVEGKRMSIWALDLVRESCGRDDYRVKPEYMRIFKMDRDAAIPALMNAVDYHPSKGRIVWVRITQSLPKQLGAALRPKPTYTINRWAGVLALSNLAREKPDARIAPFFLHCMEDSNSAVRKVAAYEAGPVARSRGTKYRRKNFGPRAERSITRCPPRRLPENRCIRRQGRQVRRSAS